MTKQKVENQTSQKMPTAYANGIEQQLLPHFFSAVVDSFKVECACVLRIQVDL